MYAVIVFAGIIGGTVADSYMARSRPPCIHIVADVTLSLHFLTLSMTELLARFLRALVSADT